MSDHLFLARILRYVASRSDRGDPQVAPLMEALEAAATDFAAAGTSMVQPERLELTARAFAGVAGFLQKQILPEAVAHGNAEGERQIRWAVDTAMAAVSLLLSRAAAPGPRQPVELRLPPPP